MKVEKIEWLNEESKEGSVVITDGKYSLLCFGYDLAYTIGDVIKEPLTCLDIDHVVRAEERTPMIQQNFDKYECFVRGQIFLEDSILKIGGIEISIEGHYYPKDIRDKEFVEMKISRIDILS
jgi:hypothetical protein